MIITYDKNPQLSGDQKLQSLAESVQLAINEIELDEDWLMPLDTKATSGTDHDIYTALRSLGWLDVIV